MTNKINLFAICGSTRKASTNHLLIQAIADLNNETMAFDVFEGLSELPHFNPDLDNEHAPKEVVDFRRRIRAADAVLICTPEYAIGVPGSLKNAVDWTVSSMEFSQKPVALITASLSGKAAHQSLLGTLLIIESKMTQATQLLIPFVKTKVNSEAKITDAATLALVHQLTQSLTELALQKDVSLLSAPILMNDGVNSGMG